LTSTCWSSPAGAAATRRAPDGPASLASQAINDQALQISAGRAGENPSRHPGGPAQITPLRAALTQFQHTETGAQIESSLFVVLLCGAEDADEGGVHDADEKSGDSGGVVGEVPGYVGKVPRWKVAKRPPQRIRV